jgi:hypothetical protein
MNTVPGALLTAPCSKILMAVLERNGGPNPRSGHKTRNAREGLADHFSLGIWYVPGHFRLVERQSRAVCRTPSGQAPQGGGMTFGVRTRALACEAVHTKRCWLKDVGTAASRPGSARMEGLAQTSAP